MRHSPIFFRNQVPRPQRQNQRRESILRTARWLKQRKTVTNLDAPYPTTLVAVPLQNLLWAPNRLPSEGQLPQPSLPIAQQYGRQSDVDHSRPAHVVADLDNVTVDNRELALGRIQN